MMSPARSQVRGQGRSGRSAEAARLAHGPSGERPGEQDTPSIRTTIQPHGVLGPPDPPLWLPPSKRVEEAGGSLWVRRAWGLCERKELPDPRHVVADLARFDGLPVSQELLEGIRVSLTGPLAPPCCAAISSASSPALSKTTGDTIGA